MSNPFQHQHPVKPRKSLGRQRFVAELTRQVMAGSVLVVSEPCCGKTSLLGLAQTHLQAAGQQVSLLYTKQMGALDPELFWEAVFAPMRGPSASSAFVERYRAARQGRFAGASLWALVQQVIAENIRLTVLVDDFDALTHHKKLGAAFFDDLQRMVNQRKAFQILATSNLSLSALRKRWERITGAAGAFSYMDEVVLGPLPSAAVHQLLRQTDEHKAALDAQHQGFIARVSGEHPYLLQLTAAALWEASRVGARNPASQRRQAAGRALSEIELSLGPAWRYRPAADRWAIIQIMLAQLDLDLPLLSRKARKQLASSGTGTALLRILGRLSEEELGLMFTELSREPLPDNVTGPAVLKAVLQQIQAKRAASLVLRMVQEWRPDLYPLFKIPLGQLGSPLQISADIVGLCARGVLVQDTIQERLKLRSELMIWWLLDQLSLLGAGAVPLDAWIHSQGLQVPSEPAKRHFLWRLGRLRGVLQRGAHPLIMTAAS